MNCKSALPFVLAVFLGTTTNIAVAKDTCDDKELVSGLCWCMNDGRVGTKQEPYRKILIDQVNGWVDNGKKGDMGNYHHEARSALFSCQNHNPKKNLIAACADETILRTATKIRQLDIKCQ